MTWRVADALIQLKAEVNDLFPGRSIVSDGSIGDAAHASRESDHNPWIVDGGIGVVSAVDITEDAEGGIPEIADFIVDTLVKSRDPRIKYIIHEAKIWRSYDKPGIPAWTPARYTGSNSHFQHVHVSVNSEKRFYDSKASWGLRLAYNAITDGPLREGMSGFRVRQLQRVLNRKGFGVLDVDGDFGPATKAAVMRAETAMGYRHVDGVVGKTLMRKLREAVPPGAFPDPPPPPAPKPPRARVPKLHKRLETEHRLGTLNVHKARGIKAHRIIRAANRTDCDVLVAQEGTRLTLLVLALHLRWGLVKARSNSPGRRWTGNFAVYRKNAFELRAARSIRVDRPRGAVPNTPLWLIEAHLESKRVPGRTVVVTGNHMPHQKYEPSTFRATRATGLAELRTRSDLYRDRGWTVLVAGDTNDKNSAEIYARTLDMQHGAGDRIDQIHGANVLWRNPRRVIRKGVLGRISDHGLVVASWTFPVDISQPPASLNPPTRKKKD